MSEVRAGLTFSVPGAPRGKGRPRFVRVTGRTYTPAETAAYESTVALCARQAMAGRPPWPRTTALCCFLRAVFPVPASWSKRKQADALAQRLLPTVKPDGDNILKALDACNGIVWADDCQVAEWGIVKVFGEVPALHVEVIEA